MGVPYLLIWLYQSLHNSFPLFQAAQFLLIGATVFYATFLSGAAFPAALHFFRNQTNALPRHVANIYSFNTVGSIAGTICAGFILIPTLGVERSIRLMGLLNLILGIVCFRKSHPKHHDKKVLAIGVACLLLLVFLPQWNQSIYNSGFYAFAYKYVPLNVSEGGPLCPPFLENSECISRRAGTPALRSRIEAGLFPVHRSSEELSLIYYGEGLTATVAVVEQEKGIRTLLINGKPDASNVPTGDMRTQLLLGHLPALVKGSSDDALVIGLGSGVTSGALVTHGVRRIDCVEIEKKVAQAARYFTPENLRVLDRKIFHLILDDGRNFVRHSTGRYDVITSEPSNLWMSGVANLFTREFFASTKTKLKPGGIMCQWIHLYQISLEDVLIFLKTFQSVFPHLSIWIDDSDMLVLGADQPIPLNRDILQQRMFEPAVWWSLQRASITPDYLFRRYIGDEKMINVVRKTIPLNVDDHPVLEFSAPKSLFVNHSNQIARSLIAFQRLAGLNAKRESLEK